MSTSVRLRTLALASVLKFGRHRDMTVQQIINLMQIGGLRYLTWCYYNCSNISFNAEILDILAIGGKNVIAKPGNVSKEEYIEHSKEVTALRVERDALNMSEEQREERKKQIMVLAINEKKNRLKGTDIHSGRFNQKGHLQALNRGKVQF
jgi:hypothetical protein